MARADVYGNRRSPIPVAASSGIPKSMVENIITLPFNDFEGFERMMRAYQEYYDILPDMAIYAKALGNGYPVAAREPWFQCYSHSDADIDETLNVYADVVKTVKR